MYRILGLAAALALIAGPAPAQQVIYEPGYCAFFYPNANCQNLGPGNPYTGGYQRHASRRGSILGSGHRVVVKKRPHKHVKRMR